MTPQPPNDIEEVELEEGPEEDESLSLPELPPDISSILITDFPPGNPRSSGFSGTLIDLMTKADNYNLVRLFEAFPVYGICFMLWDEGLITFSQDRRTVTFNEEHADKASILSIESWREKMHTLQAVLNYSRTLHNGQPLSNRDLAKAQEYGSY